MYQLRRLAAASYVLVGILIVFPVLDLLQGTWPLRPGELMWRVAFVGLLSRLLLTPLLGLLFAYGAALLLEQRRVLRTLAVINGVMALALVAVLALYALEAVELRARLPSENRNYDLGLLLSFLRFGAAWVALVVLGVSEWRAAAVVGRGRRPKETEPGSSLVFPTAPSTTEAKAPGDPRGAD